MRNPQTDYNAHDIKYGKRQGLFRLYLTYISKKILRRLYKKTVQLLKL